MKSTEESLYLAIDMVKPGVRLGDLGAAIQKYNEDNGYSVVRQFVGHGVGKTCTKIRKFQTMARLVTASDLWQVW